MNITRTMENLRKNGIEPYYIETKEEVLPLIGRLAPAGARVAIGGSETLKECGVLPFLRSGEYHFLDRYADGLSREQVEQVHRDSHSCDAYFCSSNAVTENGELYNVDGNSNRVSAIAHGPSQVIMVVGVNKLVKNLEQAIFRVKLIAAPKNVRRLGNNTYCNLKGRCSSLLKEQPIMTDGCKNEDRICCNYLVSAKQRVSGRIKLILVNESLGY